jgi:type II secretory pathway pseudopilin PulG
LVELLVSIAILTILVLLVARIVFDSSRATQLAYDQAFDDANARAVMDTVMDDIAQIVVNPMRKAVITEKDLPAYGLTDDMTGADLEFFTFPASTGTLMKAAYSLQRQNGTDGVYELSRAIAQADKELKSYPVMDHVVQFRVKFFNVQGEAMPSPLVEMPLYADVYLMVVSDDTHRRLSQLDRSGAKANDKKVFLYRNGRRHYSRVAPVTFTGRGTKSVAGRLHNLEY